MTPTPEPQRPNTVTACGLTMDELHDVTRALDTEQIQEACAHVRKGAVPAGVQCRDCRKLWAGECGDAVWKAMLDAENDSAQGPQETRQEPCAECEGTGECPGCGGEHPRCSGSCKACDGEGRVSVSPSPSPQEPQKDETLRGHIHQAMRAVCGWCNHDVPMDCYNMHKGGRECEAVRYRDVLQMMGHSHETSKAIAAKLDRQLDDVLRVVADGDDLDPIRKMRALIAELHYGEPKEPHAALIAAIERYADEPMTGDYDQDYALALEFHTLLRRCLHALKGLSAEKVYVVETPEPDSRILGIFTDKARATAWADKHDAYIETHPLVKGE